MYLVLGEDENKFQRWMGDICASTYKESKQTFEALKLWTFRYV